MFTFSGIPTSLKFGDAVTVTVNEPFASAFLKFVRVVNGKPFAILATDIAYDGKPAMTFQLPAKPNKRFPRGDYMLSVDAMGVNGQGSGTSVSLSLA